MKNYEENYGFRTIQEDMLNQRLTILQTGSKRSNIVGKTAASVAAVSLLTIIGNLLTDDPNIALQTAGTCIAMTSYAIGNAKLSNHYKKESDKIEENRTYEGVENLREIAYKDIDRAILEYLNRTIIQNINKNVLIHPDSIATRNQLMLLSM